MRADVLGYEIVAPTSTNVRLTPGKAQYAMLPVWTLHTKWQGKDYLFMMNGQTGKMVGALPTDEDKKSSFFRKDFLMAAAISGVLIGSLAWMIGFI